MECGLGSLDGRKSTWVGEAERGGLPAFGAADMVIWDGAQVLVKVGFKLVESMWWWWKERRVR